MNILIVDDEKKLTSVLKRQLNDEGYAAYIISEGEEALSHLLVNHEDYDIVLLDVMLPGKNGIEICKILREKNIPLPILMLTARDVTSDKVVGLESGADDYLTKPFSFPELLARIKALLRRPSQPLPLILTAGAISLNPNTKQVFVDKKEVELTLKEFQLLEYFLRNPNMILSRDQILSHVWDFAFDSFSNTVDVHIKNLRKKIDHKNSSILETVRGLGYRLNVS